MNYQTHIRNFVAFATSVVEHTIQWLILTDLRRTVPDVNENLRIMNSFLMVNTLNYARRMTH